MKYELGQSAIALTDGDPMICRAVSVDGENLGSVCVAYNPGISWHALTSTEVIPCPSEEEAIATVLRSHGVEIEVEATLESRPEGVMDLLGFTIRVMRQEGDWAYTSKGEPLKWLAILPNGEEDVMAMGRTAVEAVVQVMSRKEFDVVAGECDRQHRKPRLFAATLRDDAGEERDSKAFDSLDEWHTAVKAFDESAEKKGWYWSLDIMKLVLPKVPPYTPYWNVVHEGDVLGMVFCDVEAVDEGDPWRCSVDDGKYPNDVEALRAVLRSHGLVD